MYGSYQDVLKRSARFTPEGVPVWPLTIHAPDSDGSRNGRDATRLDGAAATAGARQGIGGKAQA
jgi:hypothetical protein